jgi:LysM repeat protein
MSFCVIKSIPEFKKLAALFGEELATAISINYSTNVKKIKSGEDLYYPTKKEVQEFYRANKDKQYNEVVSALSMNPYMSEDAVLSMLSGVLYKYKGGIFITKGYTTLGSLVHQAEAERLIFKPNVEIMEKLQEDFPNIFKVKATSKNESTRYVQITPINMRDTVATKERAEMLDDFYSRFREEKSIMQEVKANEIAQKLGEKFSKAFGIRNEMITAEEAYDILNDSQTPYAGEAAFFFNNTVYFVNEALSVNSVLHEYGHPLIKGIALQNPKLFQNLYNELSITPTGVSLIENVVANYPELDYGSDRFKEEVLVNALEKIAAKKVEDLTDTDSGFKAFVKKLIYAIKQVLRSLTKKVDLNKLEGTTTLEQLADMMVNEDFVIESLVFDESDFAEFKRSLEEIISDFNTTPYKALQEAINQFYNEARYELDNLKKAPAYLKKELQGKDGMLILKYIKDELSKYQTVTDPKDADVDNVILAMEDQQKQFRIRALALVNTINDIAVFVENIDKVLDNISTGSLMTQENLAKIKYYKDFLLRQEELIEGIRKVVGLTNKNEFVTVLNQVLTNIRDIKDKVKNLEFKYVVDFFDLSSKDMAEYVENKFKEVMQIRMKGVDPAAVEAFTNKIINLPANENIVINAQDFPGNPNLISLIKQDIQNYLAKRIARKQLEDYLEGKRGDIPYISAMLVPYSSIDDPLTGGFVRHMKEQRGIGEAKSLKQRDEIMNILLPHLLKVGYNANNVGALGQKILFKDKTGYVDNTTGDWIEFDVWTVKNKFQNYRNDTGKLVAEFDKAKESGDKDAIRSTYKALQDFNEKYMHRRYKDEYYNVQKIWTRSNKVINPFTKEEINVDEETSFESYIERQNALNEMNTLKNFHFTELEDVQEFTAADEARSNYQQLFDVYNPDGTQKKGKDLEKVLVRKIHKAESSKFWETSVDETRAQKDLDNFVNRLAANNITYEATPDRFNEELAKFERKNFRIAYTESYYKSRQDIFRQLREITNKPGIKSQLANDIADLYQQRYEIINQITDKNGQTNGLKYTPAQKERLLIIEEKLVELNNQFDKKTGLSIEDSTRLLSYQKRLSKNESLTTEELQDYNDLINIKNNIGISPLELEKMRQLFAELAELTVKEPTEYYIEAFNYLLRDTDINPVSLQTADEWINSPKITEAMAKSSDFKDWFLQNHYQKEVFDAEIGARTTKYFRTSIWTVSKPLKKADYKTTTLVHPVTGEALVIDGVPGGKYLYQRVKDEYTTVPKGVDRKTLVGKVIDNRGNYLPKDNVQDSPYINKEFIEQEKMNTDEYKLIKAYTDSLLMVQENRPNSSKLYLDLPRRSMTGGNRSNLEILQSGQFKEQVTSKVEVAKAIGEKIFGTSKVPDSLEIGLNANTEQMLISTDLQGKPVSKIPVVGLYRIPISDVSTDVLRGLGDYLYSLNEQEVLIKNEPLAKTINSVLENEENAIKDMNKVSSQIKRATGALSFLPSAGENRRAQAIRYFVDKVFYGQINSQFQEENVGLTKAANYMMKMASNSFIALDFVAAVKNKNGMRFQSMIEAAAGKYMTGKSYAQGFAKSKETMIQLMGATQEGIYTRGPKGLLVQMMEYFDPTTGKTEQDFSKSASRTIIKDMADFNFVFDYRRFGDLSAALELYWGVMYNTFVDQTQPDGSTKKIVYATAFEKGPDGIIKLKDGIDLSWNVQPTNHTYKLGESLDDIAKKYNVTVDQIKERNGIKDDNDVEEGQEIKISDNKNFFNVKLRIQGLGKRLFGQMDNLDSPQAKQFLGYKLMSFYRGFATGMFLHRWQYDTDPNNRFGEVYDWDLNETTQGTYVRALRTIANGFRSRGASFSVMTSEEKQAFVKVTMETLSLVLLGLAVGLVFGYDDDDKERFAKLREKEKTYGMMGWYANHMLYQVMMLKQENEFINPLFGFDQYVSFFDTTTIASAPILGNGVKIIADLIAFMTGDDSAYYKQEIGPYPWQQEGSFKLWNHLASVFGVKGKNYDPVQAIKARETFVNLSGQSGTDFLTATTSNLIDKARGV